MAIDNDNLRIGSCKAGDIVWARLYPETWWPGRVFRRDKLGVFVSFFDCERARYVPESDICSFEQNFESLFKNVECSVLLDRALELLGRRVSLSLMCPCQGPIEDVKRRNLMDVGWNSMDRVVEVTNSFKPVRVLGFVLSMAVFPWIEDASIVNAVRATVQINTFRRYALIKQCLICRGAKQSYRSRSTFADPEPISRSTYSKMRSYSSFGKKMPLVTRESGNLKLEDDCQVFSERVDKNLAVCVTNKMNSKTLVSSETSESLHEDQLEFFTKLSTSIEENSMSVQEDQIELNSEIKKQNWDGVALAHRGYNMDCSLANLNSLFSEKLNSTPTGIVVHGPNTLLFRRQSEELQFPVVSPLELLVRSGTQKGSGKQGKGQYIHDMLIYLHCLAIDPFCLGGKSLKTVERNFLKFRIWSYQDISPKTCSPCKTSEARFCHSGYEYSFKTQPSDKVGDKTDGGEVFSSLIPFMESPVSCSELKRRLDQPVFPDPFKLRKTMPFLSINVADAFLQRNRTTCEEHLSDSFFRGSQVNLKFRNHPCTGAQNLTFICNSSLLCRDLVQNIFNVSLTEQVSHRSKTVEIGKVLEPAEIVSILNDNGTCMSYVYDATDTITDEVQIGDVKVDCNFSLLQPSAFESVLKNASGTHIDDDEVGVARATTRRYPLLSHLPADQIVMQPSNNGAATPNAISRELSMKVAFEDSFKEDRELYQPVTSDLSFMSHVALQSKTVSSFALPTSLHMKFPKDFVLPSKDDLVKKFSPFGSVDSLKTKIYFYTGSAQVVFFHRLDAVAAYEYAKRKKVLFGQTNVRFWVDPFEHKRKGTKVVAPASNLKSCLKKSNPLGNVERRKPHRVKFLLENQISSFSFTDGNFTVSSLTSLQ